MSIELGGGGGRMSIEWGGGGLVFEYQCQPNSLREFEQGKALDKQLTNLQKARNPGKASNGCRGNWKVFELILPQASK